MREELGKLISQQTEAYILDKARSLGASVAVKLSLEPLGDYYLRPSAVTICGAVTPHSSRRWPSGCRRIWR